MISAYNERAAQVFEHRRGSNHFHYFRGVAQQKRSASLRKFYEDPEEMTKRVAIAAMAARSPGGRAAASARMTAIWADPKRSAEIAKKMSETKRKKREAKIGL